ncbi:MAG: cytochrome c biogenesis CcdA family protein [bacterium]
MASNLNILVAFTAGLLSFFSPCFLPLVPAYLIYITGLSFEEVKTVRRTTVIHALLFILGFTLVFTALGVLVSALGHFLFQYTDILRIGGGFLLILLGLYLMGYLKLSFLSMERKITLANKPAGYLGTIIIGMVFALAWTPCIGPILAGILVLASQAQSIGQGVLLLIAFSLGLGLPMLIVAIAVNYSLTMLKKIENYLGVIHSASGLLLIIVGLLLIGNYFQVIINWLVQVTGYQGY